MGRDPPRPDSPRLLSTEVKPTVKKLVIFLMLVAVCLAGGAYWLNHSRSGPAVDEGFTLSPVDFGPLVETVPATGGLKPREVVLVTSQGSGEVVKLYPGGEINQMVEEGQPLLQLD